MHYTNFREIENHCDEGKKILCPPLTWAACWCRRVWCRAAPAPLSSTSRGWAGAARWRRLRRAGWPPRTRWHETTLNKSEINFIGFFILKMLTARSIWCCRAPSADHISLRLPFRRNLCKICNFDISTSRPQWWIRKFLIFPISWLGIHWTIFCSG